MSDHGTMFVGFSAGQRRLAAMPESMAGLAGGARDALTAYTQALAGAYCFCPRRRACAGATSRSPGGARGPPPVRIGEMTVDEVADRLYGLPLGEFTEARNAAAAELRKAGDRAAADEVKALRRPTAAAGAANRLVREHRDEVEAYLAAAAALRDAQLAGKGDVAAAAQRERDALDVVVRLGGSVVRPTLQAAAVDDGTAGELLRGRLEREPEPAGFGTLIAHAPPAPRAAKPPKQAKPKPDDRASRAKLREAEEALAAARSAESEARQRWEETQTAVSETEAAVDRARRELARLHDLG